MSQLQSLIDQAITLFQQADHVTALTGAGISTPSGIPDFRSPTSGIWENVDPAEVASIVAFRQKPQAFYDWLHPLAELAMKAVPNAAHLALAKLEQNGHLAGIITQNIDMLHTKAGSHTIYEVHGHLREATCISCLSTHNGEMILPVYLATRQVPTCEYCGGVLKPNVILYGEVLPLSILKQAQNQAMNCDLMLVAGSSLEVSPAGELPWLAKRYGAKLIFVNLMETYLDYLADVVIRADVVNVLPQIAKALCG